MKERSAREQHAIDLVVGEIANARKKHGDMQSRHEAYAVILEELDEAKEIIWRDGDGGKLKSELTQVAAMAIRAIVDLKL